MRRIPVASCRSFFDQDSIEEGVDWKRRLGEGVRQSRLLLDFLSPNYLISKNCLWEWQEYLCREHSAARGDDGLTPAYFVTPADLRLDEQQSLADWLRAMQHKYPWFQPRGALEAQTDARTRPFVRDLNRRNKTANLELQPWFAHGPEVLRQLDAAARALDAKNTPRDPSADLRTRAERLAGLDRHIARRTGRSAPGDLMPSNIRANLDIPASSATPPRAPLRSRGCSQRLTRNPPVFRSGGRRTIICGEGARFSQVSTP